MATAINWCKRNPVIAVILIFCVGYAIFYLTSAIKWIPYPNQIDYGEGLIMYTNGMWADGTWKWDMTIPPYLPLMYGVGMPLATMPLIKIFGSELWVGRLVMFASTCAISLVVYLIIKRITGKTIYGVIGALLPFTQPVIRDWSLMARVDMLAVLFSIIGFYITLRYKGSKWIYLSIVLFTAAILTKISAIAGLGAVLIYLLIYNRKVFTKYTTILVATLATAFGVLQYVSGGEYINHVLVYLNTVDKVWDVNTIVTYATIVLLPLIAIMIIALTYVVKNFKNKDFNLIGLYFVVALVVNPILALKPGAYINYYIELIVGACLCTAVFLPSLIADAKAIYTRYKKVTASGLLIAMLITCFCALSHEHAFPFPNKQYEVDARAVTEIIQDTNRPVISENSGLVMNAGKEVYVEFFIMVQMAELGVWDDTNYVNDYKNQYFDYIILRIPTYKRAEGDGHLSREVIGAINENYTLVYEPPENYYWYGLCVYKSNDKIITDGALQ